MGVALSELADLPLGDLRTLWAERMEIPCPALSADLLRLALAWQVQAKGAGRLVRRVERKLARVEAGKAAVPIKPGTRLLRSWNGRSLIVTVTADGYEHDGVAYRSLSGIAKAVTGAHWSGPRFFGVGTPA